MQEVKLTARRRKATRKAVKTLREQYIVPGVVYGQGKDATPIEINASDLSDAYNEAGFNRLIELKIDDDKPVNTLFVDTQKSPLSGDFLHFDLYTVRMDEKIETEVPIHFEGTAPATYQKDGVLVKNLDTIEIRALPNKLPESFTVDLEKLEEINDAVHVSDLAIPEEVEVLTEPEELIVRIEPPRSEEELEELDEAIDEDAESSVAAEHGAEEAEEGEEGEAAAEDSGEEDKGE